MTSVFYTTNESEVTQLPGLYITEQNPPATVTGVSLNTVGIAGVCVRGPVNKVIEIGGEGRFKEVFGGRDRGSGGTLAGKVWKALLNKKFGKVCVVRAAAAAAVAADFTTETTAGGGGTAVMTITAANVGLWGNDVKWKVQAATDGNANHFDLLIKYLGTIYQLKNLSCYSTDDNLATVVGQMWDVDAKLVTLTKDAAGRPVNSAASVDGADSEGYTALGQVVAGFDSTPGTDGTIADSDFTATGGPMELLAYYKGIAVAFVAGQSTSAVKTKWKTLAGLVSDRAFLISPDSETVSVSTFVTEIDGLGAGDRIWPCFNHGYTLDPETAEEVITEPHDWMASILSQIDVDIHPGEEDTKQYTSGLTRLYNEALQRADYITLGDAGISALEKDEGFAFVEARTASSTPGREEITRRRMVDALILALAGTHKYKVKKKNTESRRNAMKAETKSYLEELQREERIVEDFVVDQEKLNTTATRAAGIERQLVRVKLISHMLYVQLVVEAGTTVQITERE